MTKDFETSGRSKPENDAVFRIFTNGVTPDEITATIAIEPYQVHYAGKHRHNNPKYGVYKENAWLIDSKEPGDASPEKHIDALLSLLEPHRDYLHQIDALPDSSLDFFCGVAFSNGFQLPASMLRRLSDFGFPVIFDLWGSKPSPILIRRRND